jgi:hypothetical protein
LVGVTADVECWKCLHWLCCQWNVHARTVTRNTYICTHAQTETRTHIDTHPTLTCCTEWTNCCIGWTNWMD